MTVEDALDAIETAVDQLDITDRQRFVLRDHLDALVMALGEITPEVEVEYERVFRHLNRK